MPDFSKLNEIVDSNLVIKIDEATSELVKEIQTQLNKKGLYTGEVDGIVGSGTKKALAEFKESIWLAYPDLVGASVAGSLLEIGENSGSSESSQENPAPVDTNQLTGATMKLPTGELVYANQQIVSGIFLTWGEFTKGCTRVPESKEIVANIIKTTKGFGEIRDKWGSPIVITSGYRPPAVNRTIGGASRSQHLFGLALDFYPAQGSLYSLLEVVKSSSVVGVGLGMKKGFLHVDYRNSSRVVFDY